MKKKRRDTEETEFEFDFHLDLDSVTDDSSDEEEKPRKKRAKPLDLEIPNQKKPKKKKRKPEMEVLSETVGTPMTEDFLLPGVEPQEIEDDTLAMTQPTGPESGQTKQMTVTLEYDPSILADPWFLLMECVEDSIEHELKCPAKDKDADYWFHTINHLGAMPMRTLYKDGVRFLIALYAAAYIQHHKLAHMAEADGRNTGPDISNPNFDAFAENVAQEGRHWGIRMEKEDLPRTGVSPEERQKAREAAANDPFDPNFVADKPALSKETTDLLAATSLAPKEKPPEGTIEAQVTKKAEENLEAFKATQGTEGDYTDARAKARSVYETKFAEAGRLAHLPREAWANAPYELVKMIEYTQRWFKETGSIPGYGENLIELYWESPNVNLTPEATGRRDKLIQTLRGFWQSSVAGATPESGFNVFSQSYRTTLAAMELEKLIERYANGEEISNDVRAAAIRYFHAHFPVDRLGAKPGPVSTLDPNYHEYLKLCQKYNLVPGTLLHEADL